MNSTTTQTHLSQTSCSNRSTASTLSSTSTSTRRSSSKKAKIVGAADKNIFALQDAGNTKWIDEHTHYLASSITTTNNDNNIVDVAMRASSALELAQLVGGDDFSRSRSSNSLQVLLDVVAVGHFLNPSFLRTNINSNINADMDDNDDDASYYSMIQHDIIHDDGNHHTDNSASILQGTKKKRGRLSKPQRNHSNQHSSVASNISVNQMNANSSWNDATALALAAVAYFVSLEDPKLFWGHSDAIASLARLLRWDDDTTSTSTAARTIASTLSSQLITKHSNSNKGKDHPNKRSRCKNENVANNANLDDEDDGDEARDKVPPLPPPPPVAVTTTTVDPTKRGRRKRRCMGVGNAPPVTSSSTTTTTAAQEDSNSINTSQSMNNNSPSASSSSNRSSTSTTYSIYTSNSNNLDYMGDYNDYDYNIHSNNNRARRKKESSDRSRQKQIKKLLRFVRKRELTLSLEQQQQQESSLFTDNNNNNNNNKVATTPPPVQSTMFMRVPDDITVSWLALKALQTVIMAHNNDSTSDTDEHEHEHESLSSLNNNNNKLLQKDGNMNNKYKDPMFIHTLLRESESLPHLALALRASCDRASNVLLSLTTTTATTTTSHDNGRSFGFLQDRIIMLTSIIDTVCCLTPDNRTVLCQGTGLVDYMVRLVAACCLSKHYDSSLCSQKKKKKRNHNNNNTEELILSCLKAITSLTHENRLAGEQLCKERSWCGDSRYTCDNMMSASSSTCSSEDGVRTPKSGIGIIFRVLELMIRTSDTNGEKDSSISSVSDGYQHHHQLDQKVVYDVRIFCLSILTNAAETGKNARRELSKCTVVCVDGNVNANEQVLHRPAIQWLASWIVDQTHAFRSSLVEAVPSSSSSQKSCNNGEKKKKKFQDDEGDLAAGEEESLNTTGNGFLLLACLLKRWMDCSEEETRVREMILDEMPEVEGSARRVQYIIAGLNAFLNFYHVSLDGALSDAIVTPVVKLIGELKQL